jgi:iron complex outermembrane receptor protein
MTSRLPFALALLSLLTPVLRAQTASAPAGPPSSSSTTSDGTYIALGRYEVTADPYGSRATDLISTVTVIGADQLANENADYTLELLGKIPGVTLTDFNQGVITADVSIRGFNGEGSSPHLRLLVDGIPHNLNNGYNDLGPIFPLEIERIEAVKGTADARYGLNAVGGTVAIHTYQAFDGQKYKLMAGSFGLLEAQALAGFTNGGFNQTYFAGIRHSDGYRDHATVDKQSFAGKWFYTGEGERWRLGFNARVHEFEADAPGYLTRADAARTPTASPSYSSTDGGTQDNLQFSLVGDAQFGDSLSGSARIYRNEVQRHRFVRFTAAGAQQERYEDEVHSGAVLSGRWAPADSALPLTIDAGAEFHAQDAINQRFASVARVRGAVTRNHRYELDNSGAYLSADLRPLDWLRAVAAIRADRFDGEMTNRVNGAKTPVLPFGTLWQPKFSVSAQAHATTQFYASYGRAFQIGAGSAAFGTKPLDASLNDGIEAGIRYTPRPELTVRLALWQQTATDEVKAKPDSSGDSENIGETKRDGWDLELAWRAHERVTLWGSYSQQQGELVEPGLTQPLLKGKEIDHVPDYSLKAGIDVTVTEALTASVSVVGQGDYFLTTANTGERFGDYLLVNADLRYRWRKATVGLHAKNLFDEYHEYVWNDGTQTLHSPGDGLGVFGTISLEF